ncbi:MAG: guanine nucleotide-binding protein subunit alpha [Bathelium mastoideum]|nr:MAG: guanine nucleotide-binding protein subunit alpha [Bathelium mastoideum]
MDPASIIGIVDSVMGIADVVTRSIRSLNGLKLKYRDAPTLVSTLIGQLYTTQTALDQLSSWADDYAGIPTSVEAERYAELAAQVGNALDCFGPLILSLQRDLNQLETYDASQFNLQKRISFLWNERDLNEYLTLLDRQVNALTLLLQAIQCKMFLRQRKLLAVEENQTILHLAKDCSSSVAGMDDITERNRNSIASESTTALGTAFDFDASLMSSKLYQTAQRSYLRQLINRRGRRKHPEQAKVDAIEAMEQRKAEESNTSREASSQDLALHMPFSDAPRSDRNGNEGQSATGVVQLLDHKPPRLQSRIFRRLKIERKTDIKVEYDNKPLIERDPEDKPRRGFKQMPKVLLLGTSGSGKSTLLKAMVMAQENFRYKVTDLHSFRETILSNIEQGLSNLFGAMEDLGISLSTFDRLKHPPDAIETLRVNPELRAAYNRRQMYQSDNIMDYLDEIQRIEGSNYKPTAEDILRSRVRTTGIHKYVLLFEAMPCMIFDVGGERSERRKWIHCYDNADVVIFTIDAIALNKVLYEDEECNSMQEQLVLFHSIAKSETFTTANFIVVFTRLDKLEDCLNNCNVQEYLPDCPTSTSGNTSCITYSEYLERRFTELIPEEKRAYTKVLWSDLTDPSLSTTEEILELVRKRVSMDNLAFPLQTNKTQGDGTQSTREPSFIEKVAEEAI